jgi:hypothetical protein
MGRSQSSKEPQYPALAVSLGREVELTLQQTGSVHTWRVEQIDMQIGNMHYFQFLPKGGFFPRLIWPSQKDPRDIRIQISLYILLGTHLEL